MQKKHTIFAFLFIITAKALLISGCSTFPQTVAPDDMKSAATTAVQKNISEETLKNLRYTLEILAESISGSTGEAQLVDGKFEEKFPDSASGVQVNFVKQASGDLDKDGLPDSAVILAVNTGGSGTFEHLVAVVNQDGQPLQRAVTVLGDRVKIEALDIVDGRIVVKMLVQGPSDPMCCPSQEKQINFVLQNEQLVELTP